MSIIHEALKKVQSDRSGNNILKDSSQPGQPSSPKVITANNGKKQNPGFNIISIFWGLLIAALCGLIVYHLSALNLRKKELALTPLSAVETQQQSPSPSVAAPVSVTATPKQVKFPKGEINLSGIVIMDGKNFALINNEFYETGEKVQGALITKITDDSVEILQKGKTRAIKVIRPE